MTGYPFTHFLVANDDQGKPFVWGWMKNLETAERSLLPGTWVIDEHGTELARRDA